jgi:hypothetical protein
MRVAWQPETCHQPLRTAVRREHGRTSGLASASSATRSPNEVSHDRGFINIGLTMLGRDHLRGLGISPEEARQATALLGIAAAV